MSYSLPSIEKDRRSSNTSEGRKKNNNKDKDNKTPAAVTTDDREALEGFHNQIQRRIVYRVCSSTNENEGYLKLIRNVRKQFLSRPEPEPSTSLPLISKPSIPLCTWEGRAPTLPPLATAATTATAVKTVAEANVDDEDNEHRIKTSSHPLFSHGLRFQKKGGDFIPYASERQSHLIPLTVLEETERQHLIDTELWERRVLLQMMAVSYVAFVLRVELEEFQNSERGSRADIIYREENERHWMLNESEIGVQLAKHKALLRAKEDKRRRLEEADALYPLETKNRQRDIPCQRPQQEADARILLQRYVRLKHAADIATQQTQSVGEREPHQPGQVQAGAQQTVSPARGPLTRLPLRSQRRNTIGISVYVDLLDKDAADRKLIEQYEADEFEGIMTLFREEYSVVQFWQRKRMHLERLLYWKKLREEHRERVKTVVEAEVMKIPILFTDELDGCILHEEGNRKIISAEETAYRDILHKMYSETTFCAKLNSLIAEHEETYTAFVEEEALLRQLWLQQLELALRVSFMHKWELDMLRVFLKQFSLLQFLTGQDSRCTSQIVTIQRAFRRWKNGQLGWRFTHREVGRIIQYSRDAKKIERGLNSLTSFRASIMADCAALRDEVLAIHKTERNGVCEEEFRHRTIVDSQEERRRRRIFQEKRTDILNNIIMPKIQYCFSSEIDLRRELDVSEEFERLQMCRMFGYLLSIMGEKRRVTKEEEITRHVIMESERRLFSEIYGEELDEREIIRITTMERDAALAEERRSLAESLFSRIEYLQNLHAMKIGQLMWNCKLGVLEIQACDIPPRQALLYYFFTDVRQCFTVEALRFTSECASFFFQYHCDAIYSARLALALLQETALRDAVASEEQGMWVALVTRANEEAGDQLRLLQRRVASAALIAQFYRSYRRGGVGRSGRRRYLHERYAFKQEAKELRELRAAHRLVVQRCRDALEEAWQQAYREKQQSIRLMLQVLEEKSEPWARLEIERLERIVYSVMLRNFGCSAIASEGDPVSVLWQLESYERVGIMREWRREFECVFEPKKAVFLLDIMTCKIQRYWRRYITRKRELSALHASIQQIVQQEAEERALMRLHEMDAYVFALVKPMQGTVLLKEYLMNDVPRLLSYVCVDVDLTYCIEEEEWRNRMLLLWRMRHQLFEITLEREEPRAREALEQSYFYDGTEQLELIEDESAVREILQNERFFFLLRMLLKEEHEHRRIIALDCGKTVLEMAEVESRGVLYRNFYTTLADPICVQFACEEAAVIAGEESKELQEIVRVVETEKARLERQGSLIIAQQESSDIDTSVAEPIPNDANRQQVQVHKPEEVVELEESVQVHKPEGVVELEEPVKVHKLEEVVELEEPVKVHKPEGVVELEEPVKVHKPEEVVELEEPVKVHKLEELEEL